MNKASPVTITVPVFMWRSRVAWHFGKPRRCVCLGRQHGKKQCLAHAFVGDHAIMQALRGPQAALNVWYSEKRNIRADLQKLFGEDLRTIDAVVLMTDTDSAIVPDIALPPA